MTDVKVHQRYVTDFPIDELRPHPKNPRLHDEAAIDESIETSGFYGAVIAQGHTNYLLAGHGRVKSLTRHGVRTVDTIFLDVDDATAEKILLVDNRTNDLSGYDERALLALLEPMAERGDLVGTGYSADAVDDLLAAAAGGLEIDGPDFEGDYVESPEELEARKAWDKGPTKESAGLREIVLVYDTDAYARVKKDLETIAEFHQDDSNSAMVKIALGRYAAELAEDFDEADTSLRDFGESADERSEDD